ncbi:MAG: MaoC family dehydratase N-terminal domain-containing protein [Peptococcaceae bacterium]|nr:MaoC family dehydratase N-terminal domain-containing protein [Peptococcaceae bacterium]
MDAVSSRDVFFDDFVVGGELPPLAKEPVDEVQLARYAGASGDFNPLHYVDAVGKKAGFGGVIAHGMLIMGFVGQAVTGWVPDRCLRRLKVRFVNVTRPGDAITVRGRVVDKQVKDGENIVTCEVTAVDQTGQVKLAGVFEAVLPGRG